MKKNMIALLLSIVMTVGSIGGTPVLAAETTAEEAVVVEEETVEEATESSEEADIAESVEEIEVEPSQDATESAEDIEKEGNGELPAEDEELSVDAEEVETETEGKDAALVDAENIVDSGECGENVTWTLTGTGDNLILTISGSGKMDDWRYSTDAQWYSKRDKIKTVVVESDVTSIGNNAFNSCRSLTNITIPDSVTYIGSNAFYGCSSLTSITIPGSVTIIGIAAFSGCSSLTSITILNGVTSIGVSAFYECSGLTSITIPDSVTSIGDHAFSSCSSLTSIAIPDSVTSIRDYAFSGCSSLTSITIPDSVTSIGTAAFYGCSSLTSITIPDGVTSIGTAAFYECSGLTSITIPSGVTSIGDNTFYRCLSLTSVTISDGVTSIGTYAFYKCSDLTSITIPDSLTSIGNYAFSLCVKLNSMMIPDSVTSIGDKAFQNCPSLTVLTSNNYVIEFCRLHSIRCLPYIKDVYPEIGAENVDHNSSHLIFIDFYYNVIPNDGYAYLYETGKDEPIEKIHISDSDIAGYSYSNNGLELQFSIDSLQRGKTYSIAIDKNALRFVDSHGDEVNAGFPGLDKEIWKFTTVDLDYFSFDNPKEFPVPYKLYPRFFGVWSPFIQACKENGSAGLCFGLDYLIGLNELHDGPIGQYLNKAGTTLSGLTKGKLKDIKPDGFNESLLEYLQMAFIYQYTSEMQKQAEDNLNKYDKLYNATHWLESEPITVGFRTEDGSYHAIYPIKSLVDNNAYCEVLVYDSCMHEFSEGSHSGLQTHLEKLRINKDGGECKGATYKGEDCKDITFRVISQSFNGAAGPSYEKWSLVTGKHRLEAEKLTLIESTAGEDTGADSNLYLYWLEGKALDVNLSENNTLSLIGEHDEIKVTASTGASVSLDIENNTSRIDNTNASESDYAITHSYTEDDNKQSVVIKGETSSIVNTEKTDDGIRVNNEDGIPVSAEISIAENDEEVKTVEISATTDSININYDDENTLTVTEDADSDGTYETVIVKEETAKEISGAEISGITNKTYTGKALTQSVIVKYGDAKLVQDADYTVSYKNNINAGTASVTITGIGNYTGSVTKTFTINKAVNKITAKNFIKTYSTKAQSFWTGVKVADGVRTFKSNSKSVTVSKSGKVTIKAKFIGKATITITAPETKNYKKTTKKITITVNPTKTALSSVTSPSAGKMTVKWKKNSSGTGYQIQYSTSSKFTSPKAVSVTKNTTLTKTIGSLAKGKKYYVRIRTYKTVGKTKFYSAWSTAKTVTIKK